MKPANTVRNAARAASPKLLGLVGSKQRADVGEKIIVLKLGEHALLGLRARDGIARRAEILAEAGDHAGISRCLNTDFAWARSNRSRPLSRCKRARSLVARISSLEKVAILAEPANQGLSTLNGMRAGGS